MRRSLLILSFLLCSTAVPAVCFSSGTAGRIPAPAAHQSVDKTAAKQAQAVVGEQTKESTAPSVAIESEPYNLGKALFSGSYKFSRPQLAEANVAEKFLRLRTLRSTLPSAQRAKIDPATLSQRLTNREMNALEYYLGMRFGKFVAKSPSWAKSEPPPRSC